MFLLRFVLVSILAFLLMGPMLRTISREIEKPLIILALDQSQSVVNSKDSVKRKELIKSNIGRIQSSLDDDFDVRSISFGDRVDDRIDYAFDRKMTDFCGLYNELDVRFSNRNVGALILATDGIYNESASPAYGPSRLKLPVYPLALGDTSVKRDLYISAITHNRYAYLGNAFPLEVKVDAKQAAGNKTVLTVEKDSVVLFSRTIDISGNSFHATLPFYPQADKKGIHHYRIKLAPITGEETVVNNVRDVFIEVVEEKQKILIVSSCPHPDIACIRQSLEASSNYEVTACGLSDLPGSLNGYHLVILHNLPNADAASAQLLKKINEQNTASWLILGANTSLQAFNEANTGINITQSNGDLNDVQAYPGENFTLFSVPAELQEALAGWPPLKSPFGVYQAEGGSAVWLKQRIGNVSSGQPLFSFSERNGRKTAVLCGEGIWKWRLSDFKEHGNHQISQQLLQQVVQYLSTGDKKSPFRITAKTDFKENESVIIDGVLYNPAGEMVNEPEARLKITNGSGKEYLFTMSRTERAYVLNAGVLPVGRYRFSAEVKLGDVVHREQGAFSVSALQIETAITTANHQVLRVLASKTGGAVYYPGQTEELINAIRSNENLKPVSFMNRKLKDLIELPWFFFLLILLISAEWFIRKRSGSY